MDSGLDVESLQPCAPARCVAVSTSCGTWREDAALWTAGSACYHMPDADGAYRIGSQVVRHRSSISVLGRQCRVIQEQVIRKGQDVRYGHVCSHTNGVWTRMEHICEHTMMEDV